MATHVRFPRHLSDRQAAPLGLPSWARHRIGLAASVVALAIAIGTGGVRAAGFGGSVPGALVLALVVAGGLVLVGITVAVVHRVLVDQEQQLALLRAGLRDCEAGRRTDRALLHEVRTAVAGVASAHRLVGLLPQSERRDGLASMMGAELDRLQRRLDPQRGADATVVEVDVDDVVGRLVLAHRARGRHITWEPTRLPAARLPRGGADDVARILDVLLENAALHGCPESIAVGVGSLPQGVEVVVTDGGPGVPTALRARVFDWGVRRPESPGQGIGLHTAAGLARRVGG
jgi:signal transduction histidine kinase